MTPFFSIIIPLYNKENHIKSTLKSALAQTFVNFEIVIVNDGSTDQSVSEIENLSDERIQLFNIQNSGVSFARNYGIKKSCGTVIAFLDADDSWYPNHLADLKILFDQFPNCGLYCKGYESVINGNNVFKAKFLDLSPSYFGIVEDYFHHSLINQIAWTSAVAIPKNILDTYGCFDIAMKAGEDTDLWTRIALQENVAFDSKISAQKIISTSQNHLSQSAHVIDKLNLLDKFLQQEKTNHSFKKYMDYNRFAIVIERKMAGDIENAEKIRAQIHSGSLNQKQLLLMNMPAPILKLFKELQRFLLRHSIYLSAFR